MRRQQHTQEEPRSAPRIDEERVLAGETQPGRFAVVALQDGPGIDVDAAADLARARLPPQPIGQRRQPRGHDLVVINAPGVVGDTPARRVGGDGGRQFGGVVIQPHDHHRANAGQDDVKVLPAGLAIRPGHIAHLAVLPGGYPAQVGVEAAGGGGGNDAGAVEAQYPGLVYECRGQTLRRGLHGKNDNTPTCN